jgi:hypothetical protein
MKKKYTTPTEKKCTMCKMIKPATEYTKIKIKVYKNKQVVGKASRLRPRCKECIKSINCLYFKRTHIPKRRKKMNTNLKIDLMQFFIQKNF